MKPASGDVAGFSRVRDCIADPHVGNRLDAGDDEADLARAQRLDRLFVRREVAEAHHLARFGRAHQADLHPAPQLAVEHPHQADHALVGVIPTVEDQRAERLTGEVGRRRYTIDHRLEDLVDPHALLGAGQDRVARVEPDNLLDLLARARDIRARQVDLVDHRHDFESMVERHIDVRQRLRLDPLAGVDHQQRAFAGGQTARHFVGEVNVAGSVDQIQNIGAAVLGSVIRAAPNGP